MTDHVSSSNMKLFCMRALPEVELAAIARHLTDCAQCHRLLTSSLREHDLETPRFTLAPEFWLRHEHIDYDQLVELADNRLDASERESINAHLKTCQFCQEDVRSFLAFREQIAPEMKVSYAPMEQSPVHERLPWISWWRDLAWKPLYATAFVILGIAVLIGAVLLLTRRSENLEARQPTPQVSPDNRVANLPSPLPGPTESPLASPTGVEAIAVLNDRGATVTVYKDGSIAGLDDV